ncbi:MAG: ATP-binding protein [Streptosporangiaceae bacterium]
MATVEVAFTPLPAHVRTARLVATAVARRSGVSETLLDEVRLAVGEACSRAVEAHRQQCPSEPIRVALRDQAGRFEIEVVHVGRVPGAGGDPGGEQSSGPEDGVPLPAGLSLAVISGLADEVHISETAAGTSLRMSWPLTGSRPAAPGR